MPSSVALLSSVADLCPRLAVIVGYAPRDVRHGQGRHVKCSWRECADDRSLGFSERLSEEVYWTLCSHTQPEMSSLIIIADSAVSVSSRPSVSPNFPLIIHHPH